MGVQRAQTTATTPYTPARSVLAAAPARPHLALCAPVAPADPDLEWEAAFEAMEEDPYFFHDEAADGGFEDLEAAIADEDARYKAICKRLYATQKAKIFALARGALAAPPATLPALGALRGLQVRSGA